MPGDDGEIWWYSPDPRAVLPLDALHVSRSLRRVLPRFEVTVDTAFSDVIAGCSNRGEGDWIDDTITAVYTELHELGFAHSVEVWTREPRRLAGGLYGIALGGLFAAESKFHVVRDASKVAVVALVELLRAGGDAGRPPARRAMADAASRLARLRRDPARRVPRPARARARVAGAACLTPRRCTGTGRRATPASSAPAGSTSSGAACRDRRSASAASRPRCRRSRAIGCSTVVSRARSTSPPRCRRSRRSRDRRARAARAAPPRAARRSPSGRSSR